MTTAPASFPQRLTIAAGVTGHCSIPEEHEERIRRLVQAILNGARECSRQMASEINSRCARPAAKGGKHGPLVRERQHIVCSCLAPGADRLVTQEARQLGFSLNAWLPFPRDQISYWETFDALDDILGPREAPESGTTVIELESEDFQADGDAVKAEAIRQNHFQRANQRLVEHSDLFIAIWNGEFQSAPGSTCQTILHALQARKPVFWIVAAAGRDCELRYCRPSEEHSLLPPRTDPDSIRARFTRLDAAGVAAELCKALFPFAPQDTANNDLESLRECFRDIERCASENRLIKWLTQSWNRALKKLATPQPSPAPQPAAEQRITPPRPPQELLSLLETFDNLAGMYARYHRSYFLWMPILGVLAVTFAVCALAFASQLQTMIALGVLELLTLLLILFLYSSAHRGNWQTKLADYRLIAEILRVNTHLSPLGVVCDMQKALPNYNVQGTCWKGFLLRRLLRNVPLRPSPLITDGNAAAARRQLLTDWINDQKNYHRANAHRLHSVEHRLHHWVLVLFYSSMGCAALHLLLEILHLGLPHVLLTLLTVLTILLPLYSMGIHAISQYADLHRLAQRSEAMRTTLEQLDAELPSRLAYASSVNAGLTTADVMLADVTEWSVQSQMAHVSLG